MNVSPAAVRPPIVDDLFARVGEQHLARSQLAGRAHERLPEATRAVGRFEQQHLGCAARPPGEAEAGRDHLGLVDDEQVAGTEELGEVTHDAVIGWRGSTVDQQPRRVARLDGHLGDAVGGQLVVELIQPHGAPRYGSRRSGGAA